MKCPFCKHTDTQVVDTRLGEEGDNIRRRRRCLSCDKRFTTFEMVELRMPQVVKQNGMRSDFDAEKLRTSFNRALHKRPVPTELVDAAIDHITQKVFAFGEREIGSRQIGEMVMKELLKLDKVGATLSYNGVDVPAGQDLTPLMSAVKGMRPDLVAFGGQRYFEWQVEEGRKLSQ